MREKMRPVTAERLEDRRLLAGQIFAGLGPVVAPSAIGYTTADVNGDGRPDLIAAGRDRARGFNADTKGMLSVALGNGDGTFAAAVNTLLTDHPSGVVAADFDGDGKIDFAVPGGNTADSQDQATIASSLTILRNTTPAGSATPSFVQTRIVAGQYLNGISVGDFNYDGRPDVVTTSIDDGVVHVFRNTGTGPGNIAFVDRTFAGLQPGGYVSSGDFNFDGRPDFAIGGEIEIGKVRVFYNTTAASGGSVNFTSADISTSGAQVLVTDLNSDGNAELVVSGGYLLDSVKVYRSTGNSPSSGGDLFYAPVEFTTPNQVEFINTGDLNGDGRQEIICSVFLNASTDTYAYAAVLRSTATPGGPITGVFSSTPAVNNYAGRTAVADFDGDGRPDLTIDVGGTNVSQTNIIRGTGSGAAIAFAPNGRVSTPVGHDDPSAIAVADFDGDTKPDVVTANPGSNTLSIQRNTTTTAGSPPTFVNNLYSGITTNRAVLAADFDGDGKPDLAALGATTSGQFAFKRNISTIGTIAFATPVFASAGNTPRAMAAADFDGDGKPDILYSDATGTLRVLRNTTAGPGSTLSFTLAYTNATAALAARAIVTGDFNNDGKVDAAVGNFGDGSGTGLAILTNTGTGVGNVAFNAFTVGTSAIPESLAAFDYDNDGKIDLAVGGPVDGITYGAQGDVHVQILRNTTGAAGIPGAIGFTKAADIAVAGFLPALVATDLDGDGRRDLLGATGFDSQLLVLRNFGNGVGSTAFVPSTVYGGVLCYGVAAADFNLDGAPDAAITSYSSGGTGAVNVLTNQLGVNPFVAIQSAKLVIKQSGVSLSTNGNLITATYAGGSAQFAADAISGLTFNANANVTGDLGNTGKTLDVTIAPGAAVNFTATQQLGALTANGTANVMANGSLLLRVNGVLSIGSAGRIDLNDNAIIYDYATTAGQAAVVRGLIAAGRAGGAWTGYGLTSTAAKNNSAGTTTLGYLEASAFHSLFGARATFAGQAVDDTAVLVRYTLNGDTDLDRGVSINDFNRLTGNFSMASGKTWLDGDLDYDGGVSINDFNLLAGNFGKTLAVAAPLPQTRKGVAPSKR